MIDPSLDIVLLGFPLKPSPTQFEVFAASIYSNIPLPYFDGLSPTPDSAYSNIAPELSNSDLHVSAASPTKVLLRKSTRVFKPPSYLRDFH